MKNMKDVRCIEDVCRNISMILKGVWSSLPCVRGNMPFRVIIVGPLTSFCETLFIILAISVIVIIVLS